MKSSQVVGDPQYRTWVRHTQLCATCRAHRPCLTSDQLGRAWREARR